MPKTVRDLRNSTDAWLKGPVRESLEKHRQNVKKLGMECEKKRQDFKTYIRNFYG